MNARTNPVVGSTATYISRHGLVDVSIRGKVIFFQQRGCAHDLAGLAVTALRHVERDPRVLQRLARVGGYHRFNGKHFLTRHRRNRRNAATRSDTVDVYGTSPALRDAAAELGARHIERISQNPKKRR